MEWVDLVDNFVYEREKLNLDVGRATCKDFVNDGMVKEKIADRAEQTFSGSKLH